MSNFSKRMLFWIPRVLSIIFIAFLSLFALDVFSEDYSFWQTVLALIIHLIPSIVFIVALILAWRWEWIGSIAFTALGIVYIVMFRDREFSWSVYVMMSGPLFLLGILFLINWLCRKQLRTGS